MTCFQKILRLEIGNFTPKIGKKKILFGNGTGLENSTRPLVFTSVSGRRASEYFDISTEN